MYSRCPRTGWIWPVGGLACCLALACSAAGAADASRAETGAVIYANRCAGRHGEELHNTIGGWSFDLRRLRPHEHDQ
jgi:hypothetical protein